MDRVKIVTDSTADIPQELVDKYGIIVVPLKINFGKEVYRDGIDIKSNEFIARLASDDILPVTSQPSPGEFVAVYEKIIAMKDIVISIHLSGQLSGTFQSAKTAKAMTDSRDIHIIDSKTVSMGLGLIVLAAAKAASEGASTRDIITLINEKIDQCLVIFLVETLDFLEKGGRIGKASAFLGTLLKIKPILTIEDGQIIPLERVRGTNKAIARITQLVNDRTDRSKRYNCSLVYGTDYPSIVVLGDQIKCVLNCPQPIISELGPVVMAHAGPEVVGIAICPE